MNKQESITLLKYISLRFVLWLPISFIFSSWIAIHFLIIIIFLLAGIPFILPYKNQPILTSTLWGLLVALLVTIMLKDQLNEIGIVEWLPRLLSQI